MSQRGGGSSLRLGIGIASETGLRQRNEDFAGAARPSALQMDRFGQAVALADGIGGAKGGREAAETVVRGFLDGYYDMPESGGIRRAAFAVLESLNGWIYALAKGESGLAGMGTTFTGLVLRGRTAHLLHVGDSRLYRFSEGRLSCLTEDHTLSQPGLNHVLYRAIGLEAAARLDYARHPLSLHDRYLLCSDGIHGALGEGEICEILGRQQGPEETARALIAAALTAGSQDNATALVVDVLDLPPADRAGLSQSLARLPVLEPPKLGQMIDGFRLTSLLSDGRYAKLYIAEDALEGGVVVLKFPRPRRGADTAYHAAFLREAWVAAQVRSPFLGSVITPAPERQTALYTIMPHFAGETLEQRLRRQPALGLEEGRTIGIALAKALLALHRAGILHRDVKPENIILGPDGLPRLIDLGIARVSGLEESQEEVLGQSGPGTPSYMAPELLAGQQASERTDLYALGVTLFRAWSGVYPYGEVEAFSSPRFGKPRSLTQLRPDLPSWLDYCLGQAIAISPQDRFSDVAEMLLQLERGPSAVPPIPNRHHPLYQRNPLMFWQGVSVLLALGLLYSLLHK